MDSSRTRENFIQLHSRDIESLKKELEMVLRSIGLKQPRDVTLVSVNVPQGFGFNLEPGESSDLILAYPMGGTLKNFFTYADGAKEVALTLTAYSSTASVRHTPEIKAGWNSLELQIDVPKNCFVVVRAFNGGKTKVSLNVGFSYKEVLP